MVASASGRPGQDVARRVELVANQEAVHVLIQYRQIMEEIVQELTQRPHHALSPVVQ